MMDPYSAGSYAAQMHYQRPMYEARPPRYSMAPPAPIRFSEPIQPRRVPHEVSRMQSPLVPHHATSVPPSMSQQHFNYQQRYSSIDSTGPSMKSSYGFQLRSPQLLQSSPISGRPPSPQVPAEVNRYPQQAGNAATGS